MCSVLEKKKIQQVVITIKSSNEKEKRALLCSKQAHLQENHKSYHNTIGNVMRRGGGLTRQQWTRIPTPTTVSETSAVCIRNCSINQSYSTTKSSQNS